MVYSRSKVRGVDKDEYTDEEAERRAREAIRRSFETPYKPQREMIGKTRRPSPRKSTTSKTSEKTK
jgi:hypothetical protein